MDRTSLSVSELIGSMRNFLDTIWEIDVDTGELLVWHDTAMPETCGRVISLEKDADFLYGRYQYGPDLEVWREQLDLQSLRAFVAGGGESRRFELRLTGKSHGFEWREVYLKALPGEENRHSRVLLYGRSLDRFKRAEAVERAVRGEYDYVAYIDVASHRYVLYLSNLESGTPIPPQTGEDFERAMVAYNQNRNYMSPVEMGSLTQNMRLANVLRHVEEDGDYVLYCQVQERGMYRDKKLRFSFDSRENGTLLLTRTDVTEAREESRQKELLEDALRAADAANRAKSEFLSRMSHDIRTPMNAIVGLTAIAGAHIDNPERTLDCLKKITSSSKLLLSLINEVLDMSKIESGRMALAEEPFGLSTLFGDLVGMIQPEIDAKGHNLNAHIEGVEHEAVVGDLQRLQQVMMNLLSNAIKYTPAGGNILLEVAELPSKLQGYGRYQFTVTDNGIGMRPEFLNRIFAPFERADDQRVRNEQGTGLGMAISRNIVRMMDGDIQVESQWGKGSRFTVSLCLKLQPKEFQEIDGEEALVDLPVLVADDDRVVCEETCACLGDIGMKSRWVLSGREAVEEVLTAHRRGEDFFAVIVDLRIPDMNGIEVTRRIRREVGIDVPIIVISAYDSAKAEIEARQAGANAFISKPIFRSKLVYLLKSLVVAERRERTAVQRLPKADLAGRRVLLVEDNLLNQEIAVELIGNCGVAVETAENGKRAVEKFISTPEGWYDLIFMDVQMPVMNGYEAARAIRALDRKDAGVPIVAMTANAFAEDVRMAMEAGMNQHVAKPIDIGQLMDVMQHWLGDPVI